MRASRRVIVALILAGACGGDPTAPSTITSVTVTVPSSELAAGANTSASVAVVATGGAPLAVQWISDDPATVSVNGAGTITAHALTAGVPVCAVSTFDSAKKGCVTIKVYTDRTVRYWLAIPATVSVVGKPAFKVTGGESFAYRSYGTEFGAKLDPLRYSDGTPIPADMDTPFCLFFAGVCDVTASLIIDYYTPDISNQTTSVLSVQIRRPTAGSSPVYTCMVSIAPGTVASLPYYQSFGGNPTVGELRVFAGSGCSGAFYNRTISGINYQTNPSGLVTVTLTAVP